MHTASPLSPTDRLEWDSSAVFGDLAARHCRYELCTINGTELRQAIVTPVIQSDGDRVRVCDVRHRQSFVE